MEPSRGGEMRRAVLPALAIAAALAVVLLVLSRVMSPQAPRQGDIASRSGGRVRAERDR